MSLGERSARTFGTPRPAPAGRHCWVSAPEGSERWPGLLVEWRHDDTGWVGRCIYTVHDGDQAVVVEAWVPVGKLDRA